MRVSAEPLDSAIDLASSGGKDALIAKAKQEGALLVYGAPSQDKMSEWFKGFTARYGIPVQYYRAPSNPLYQRFLQEQAAGRALADALFISDPNVNRDAIKRNLIATYTPQTADQFPVGTTIGGKAYPLYLTTQAVGWNTRVVPADLQDKLKADPFGALLDPRFAGKIVVVSVTAGGPQLAQAANLVYNQADKYGWPYLEKLAAQNPGFVNTTPNALDAVVAGDYWATPDANPSVFAPKVIEGAAIAFRSPDVASAVAFMVSVVRNAAHPYAARLFDEWATSLDAQSELARITSSEVTIKGWQDDRAVRKLPWYEPAKTLWFDADKDERLTGDQLKTFYRRWLGLFKH